MVYEDRAVIVDDLEDHPPVPGTDAEKVGPNKATHVKGWVLRNQAVK